MSETVHYKGKLTKLYYSFMPLKTQLNTELSNKGDRFYVSNLDDYEEALERLREFGDYHIYKDNLYLVEKEKLDPYSVASAYRLDDGTISFEVMYYNGGCDFYEALDSALEGI